MPYDSTPEDEEALERFAGELGDAVALDLWHEGQPVFITPADDANFEDGDAAALWIKEHRSVLDPILAHFGSYVIRDFPIQATDDFAGVAAQYEAAPFNYAGGASLRGVVKGQVFEATRAPAQIIIPLHQEMAYLPIYPRRLAFYCHKASDTGGETILANVRGFEREAPEDFTRRLEEKGVLYQRSLRAEEDHEDPILTGIHRTWSQAFQTDDPKEAERLCTDMGLDFRWEDDGSLTTLYRASGFVEVPETGERMWFNQITSQTLSARGIGEVAWSVIEKHYPPGRILPYETRYGDGEPIDAADINRLWDIYEDRTVAFPWQDGDVMIIDNYITAHGRNSFTGERDVQVSLLV